MEETKMPTFARLRFSFWTKVALTAVLAAFALRGMRRTAF